MSKSVGSPAKPSRELDARIWENTSAEHKINMFIKHMLRVSLFQLLHNIKNYVIFYVSIPIDYFPLHIFYLDTEGEDYWVYP